MTKQEEIREGIKLWFKLPNLQSTDEQVNEFIEWLNSKDVRMKVTVKDGYTSPEVAPVVPLEGF